MRIMRLLKKSAIVLVLLLAMAANAYAVNVVDAMTCKKVVLRVTQRTILVQRLTGKVRYLLISNGEWMPLRGREKKAYQMLYDAQSSAREK
jgi:hypothetical protein